jgi:CRISPR-associated endonuclease/helicase Cas3
MERDGRAEPAFFAHTLPDRPAFDWQKLPGHLKGVAERGARSASEFSAEEWGYIAGIWHDLGKFSAAFQSYLRTAVAPDAHIAEGQARIDHSTAGAQWAVSEFPPVLAHLLAFVIAGHHSGLLDSLSEGASLDARLRKEVESYGSAPDAILNQTLPSLPEFLQDAFGHRDQFAIQFFVRMLFSCLVDADFLDTEEFMDPGRATDRPTWPSDVLERMSRSLEAHLAQRPRSSGTDD